MTAIYAGWVTLIGSVLIVLITLFVMRANSPEKPTQGVMAVLYRIRFRYFLILLGLLVLALVVTLPMAPYPAPAAEKPDARVTVTGYMWYWDLRTGPDTTLERTPAGGFRIPSGTLVEFQVTAADVNHGFGLYDAAGRLRAQTQAMPGYTNRLRYRFDESGTYRILCMEFCGTAHHAMTSEIVVE